MRATTVRFSDDLWSLLEVEASEQGISAAQFVRDATIMRLGVLSARRGDEEANLTLADVAAQALAGRPAPAPGGPADPERLAELRLSGLLDTPADPAFERITALAAQLLEAPVALVSLVDEDRQFFKSCLGLPEPWATTRQTPLSHSFCQLALESPDPIVIPDARVDPRVRENLAIRDLDVVAYLGLPLITARGHTLGTLCVIDHQPRDWSGEQVDALSVLARSAVSEIELAIARSA